MNFKAFAIVIFHIILSPILHAYIKNDSLFIKRIYVGVTLQKEYHVSLYSYEWEEYEWSIRTHTTDFGSPYYPANRKIINGSLGIYVGYQFSKTHSFGINIFFTREDAYIAAEGLTNNIIAWYYTDLTEVPIWYSFKTKTKTVQPFLSAGIVPAFIYFESVEVPHKINEPQQYISNNSFMFYRLSASFNSGVAFCIKDIMTITPFIDYRTRPFVQTFSTIDRIRTSKICFGIGINYSFRKKTE